MNQKLSKSLRLYTFGFIAIACIALLSGIWLFYMYRHTPDYSKANEEAQSALGLMMTFFVLSVAASLFNAFASFKVRTALKSAGVSGGMPLAIGAVLLVVNSIFTGTVFGGNAALQLMIGGVDTAAGALSAFCLILYVAANLLTFIGINKAASTRQGQRNAYSGFYILRWMMLGMLVIALAVCVMTFINADVKSVESTLVDNIILGVAYVAMASFTIKMLYTSQNGRIIDASEYRPLELTKIHPELKAKVAETGKGYLTVWVAVLLSCIVLKLSFESHSAVAYVFNYLIFGASIAALVFAFKRARLLCDGLTGLGVSWAKFVIAPLCVLIVTSVLSFSSIIGYNPLAHSQYGGAVIEGTDSPSVLDMRQRYAQILVDNRSNNMDDYDDETGLPPMVQPEEGFDKIAEMEKAMKEVENMEFTTRLEYDSDGKLVGTYYEPKNAFGWAATLSSIASIIYFLFPLLVLVLAYLLETIMPTMKRSRMGAWILFGSTVIFFPMLLVESYGAVGLILGLIAYGVGLWFFIPPWMSVEEIAKNIQYNMTESQNETIATSKVEKETECPTVEENITHKTSVSSRKNKFVLPAIIVAGIIIVGIIVCVVVSGSDGDQADETITEEPVTELDESAKERIANAYLCVDDFFYEDYSYSYIYHLRKLEARQQNLLQKDFELTSQKKVQEPFGDWLDEYTYTFYTDKKNKKGVMYTVKLYSFPNFSITADDPDVFNKLLEEFSKLGTGTPDGEGWEGVIMSVEGNTLHLDP